MAGASRRASTSTYAAVFLASRVVLIAIVWLATRGSELSDDVGMHVEMIHAPLEPLLGRGAYAQHPPLLALLEGAVFRCFEPWLSTFLAVRCTYVVFETIAAALVYLTMQRSRGEDAFRGGVLLLTLPCGFLSSAVLPQDECVAYAFVAAALLAIVAERYAVALAVLSLGVVSAKLMLIVPLAALVALLPAPRLATRLVYAVVPIAVIQGIGSFARHSTALPEVVHFAPPAAFSVNAWVFLVGRIEPESAKLMSTIAGLSLAAITVALARRAHGGGSPLAAFVSASAALAWFFVGFYHVNPEYFVLLAPAIALCCRSPRQLIIAYGATAIPWVANVAYGIHFRASIRWFDGAKGQLAQWYVQHAPISTEVVHATAVIGTTLALAALAWTLQRHARP
jgi:hypothetical protein